MMSNLTGKDHNTVKERIKIFTPTNYDRFPVSNNI